MKNVIPQLAELKSEYDKLCPKPSQFGEWKYCIIDENSHLRFFYSQLDSIRVSLQRDDYDTIRDNCDCVKLPFGIDWRLCKWSLDDAKQIHGEQ